MQISQLDSGKLLHSLSSERFVLSKPNVTNREMIPDDVLDSMRPAWEQMSFPERSIRIVEFKDVVVAGEGLVFTMDGSLLAETRTQHSDSEIELARRKVEFALKMDVPTVSGTCVLCVKRGFGNYGHWLLEMLPKASLAHETLQASSASFIIPAETGPMRSVVRSCMARLGIDEEALIELSHHPIRVETLVIVDGLTNHGTFMSPDAVRLARALRPKKSSSSRRRIFVTRSKACTRRIVNDGFVTRFAESRGYTVVDPGQLSFDKQREVFSEASHVVGVMGAGMSNIVFSPEETAVTVLAPASMPDTFFWFLSGLSKHRYREIRCASSRTSSEDLPWNTDILVSPADVVTAFR